MTASPRAGGVLRPISAGLVSALVGFTSAFVVVLAGLAGVGADHDQASSGLLAVSVTMGLACILLASWTRMPVTVAWSTPGAALLASVGGVEGGWPAAVGAFVVTGVLILLTGLIPQLGALIARIPASVAQAMLAGVLLQLCLGPIAGLAANPLAVAPVVIVWLLALRLLPRWAAPLAFLTAAIVIGVHVSASETPLDAASLVPRLELTSPAFTVGGVVGIVMAFRGSGVWALVGQQVAREFTWLILLWRVSPWLPRLGFCWQLPFRSHAKPYVVWTGRTVPMRV